jgi:hypothetical protein
MHRPFAEQAQFFAYDPAKMRASRVMHHNYGSDRFHIKGTQASEM